jgi:hypothetical protein
MMEEINRREEEEARAQELAKADKLKSTWQMMEVINRREEGEARARMNREENEPYPYSGW